jgi:hypothetical protein
VSQEGRLARVLVRRAELLRLCCAKPSSSLIDREQNCCGLLRLREGRIRYKEALGESASINPSRRLLLVRGIGVGVILRDHLQHLDATEPRIWSN